VFTDVYCEGIFSQKNSPQSTDRKLSSMFLFVFTNFLIEGEPLSQWRKARMKKNAIQTSRLQCNNDIQTLILMIQGCSVGKTPRFDDEVFSFCLVNGSESKNLFLLN
jgi:hypothetical protein